MLASQCSRIDWRNVNSMASALAIGFACGSILAFDANYREIENSELFDKADCQTYGTFVLFSGLFGFCFGYPVAFLMRRLSAMWLCVISCLLTTVGQMLLWSVIEQPDFYTDFKILIYFYALLAGQGLSFIYHTAVAVIIVNTRLDARIFRIGAFHSMMFLSAFFQNTLLNKNIIDELPLGSVYLFQLALIMAAQFIGILFLRCKRPPQEITLPSDDLLSNTDQQRLVNETSERRRALTECLRDIDELTVPAVDFGSYVESNDDLDSRSISPNTSRATIIQTTEDNSYEMRQIYIIPITLRAALRTKAIYAIVIPSAWLIAVNYTMYTDVDLYYRISDDSSEGIELPLNLVRNVIFTILCLLLLLLTGLYLDLFSRRMAPANFTCVTMIVTLAILIMSMVISKERRIYLIYAGWAGCSVGLILPTAMCLILKRLPIKHISAFWSSTLMMCIICIFGIHNIPFFVSKITGVCTGQQCLNTIILFKIGFAIFAGLINCYLVDFS